MRDLLKKLHRYEIKIRKAVNTQMQGDFHSVFKGSGLEFDDVRTYQYGDDVRTIDWISSAKGHGTFVKTFKEEKEQTVFFILDVSGSQEIGKPGQQKLDVGKEICGVLSISAVKEGSQIGLICFSDQKEKYIRPGKGSKMAYQLISTLYNLQVRSRKTNLKGALALAMQLIKRRSVIILVSDFLDKGYEKNLKALSRKHDVIVIHIFDPQEENLPKLGILPLLDKESGKTMWVNTSSGAFRQVLKKTFQEGQEGLEELCRKNQADYLKIDTSKSYLGALIKLFKVRNRTKKSA